MKRTAKIINQTDGGKYKCWEIKLYIDGGYIVNYTRFTRQKARELARQFIMTGICPMN